MHTSCRIAIDLRKSKAQPLLQSPSFPKTPVPIVTIADVLEAITADLYIEAMEPVETDKIASSTGMMRKLQQISKVQSADPDTSIEVAWKQRKCRRLIRYPTAN